ncbi:hypothetical protein BX616_001824 [Lobosporangium transversale]|uniref:Uncharacterized protein n=1 Tax=Lobosporangium transversale TaxID=64571 RepID=A0A1Y2GKH2_9FUNG|nr:hypothetical protein BCR41DRAFT_396969 [Lobosporangium transversale]KAF9919089.1 hypothetical protein BX616_001824 [Lobosporangium transversale]ORZ13796.1 hypothetical protein BCR41DRAFT_396969 [Lobosporangium transversale]|eukprot:XP_021880580.1 hypothetical protein BCR41DRAFT_396969 [Lobosporangium transversale]
MEVVDVFPFFEEMEVPTTEVDMSYVWSVEDDMLNFYFSYVRLSHMWLTFASFRRSRNENHPLVLQTLASKIHKKLLETFSQDTKAVLYFDSSSTIQKTKARNSPPKEESKKGTYTEFKIDNILQPLDANRHQWVVVAMQQINDYTNHVPAKSFSKIWLQVESEIETKRVIVASATNKVTTADNTSTLAIIMPIKTKTFRTSGKRLTTEKVEGGSKIEYKESYVKQGFKNGMSAASYRRPERWKRQWQKGVLKNIVGDVINKYFKAVTLSIGTLTPCPQRSAEFVLFQRLSQSEQSTTGHDIKVPKEAPTI